MKASVGNISPTNHLCASGEYSVGNISPTNHLCASGEYLIGPAALLAVSHLAKLQYAGDSIKFNTTLSSRQNPNHQKK